MSRKNRVAALAAVVGASAVVSLVDATWSIVIVDTRTGEVGLASATCLTGFDLQANTPVMLMGVGGATAQSYVDTNGYNRTYIRDHLLDGWTPAQILAGLSAFDTGHQTRQYGIADVRGGAVTFSGSGAGVWKGGETGSVGDLVFAVQGNVLTGNPVVSLAVDAIVNTPGDIAEKLMAGMEAARSMGGDGRCSCSQSKPDSCGAPPPNFEKSAHIAYMLIARRGDVDGSNANYRTAATPMCIASADFDSDSREDIVIGGGAVGTLSFLRNITPERGLVRMASPVNTQFGGTLRDLVVFDLDADYTRDLLAIDSDGARFIPLRGQGDGSFVAEPAILLPTGPRALTLFDVDSDGDLDAAIVSQTAPAVTILRNDSGVFSMLSNTGVGAGPNLIASGDLDGDSRPDLVVGDLTGKSMVLLRNAGNDGTLETLGTLPLPAAALAVVTRDIDGDAVPEVFATVNNAEQAVRMYTRDGANWNLASIPIIGTGNALRVADVNADGIVDLAVTTRSAPQRLNIVLGHGDATFDSPRAYPTGWTAPKITVADLNADASLDIACVGAGGAILMQAREPGAFNPQSGQGGGDYYMTFNVPNQTASDPDPVYTLRNMFDAWRSGLVGVADGVKSQATPDQSIIRAVLRSSATITISLRDFAGTPVTIDPAAVRLSHAPGSDRTTTLGPVEASDHGTLIASVTAGTRCGVDKIEVVVAHQPRDIILMPSISLVVTSPADLNLDGRVDDLDYQPFVEVFETGSADADFNTDCFVNALDYDLFAEHYESGC